MKRAAQIHGRGGKTLPEYKVQAEYGQWEVLTRWSLDEAEDGR